MYHRLHFELVFIELQWLLLETGFIGLHCLNSSPPQSRSSLVRLRQIQQPVPLEDDIRVEQSSLWNTPTYGRSSNRSCSLVPSPYFSRIGRRALRAGVEKVGPGTHCLRMCQNTLEFWGIVTLSGHFRIFLS